VCVSDPSLSFFYTYRKLKLEPKAHLTAGDVGPYKQYVFLIIRSVIISVNAVAHPRVELSTDTKTVATVAYPSGGP
jgi:hypothetical protein